MADIERIWRITADSRGRIEVRLFQGPQGEAQLSLERDFEPVDGAFEIPVARAVAQAMLEACEVASALLDRTVVIR